MATTVITKSSLNVVGGGALSASSGSTISASSSQYIVITGWNMQVAVNGITVANSAVSFTVYVPPGSSATTSGSGGYTYTVFGNT